MDHMKFVITGMQKDIDTQADRIAWMERVIAVLWEGMLDCPIDAGVEFCDRWEREYDNGSGEYTYEDGCTGNMRACWMRYISAQCEEE